MHLIKPDTLLLIFAMVGLLVACLPTPLPPATPNSTIISANTDSSPTPMPTATPAFVPESTTPPSPNQLNGEAALGPTVALQLVADYLTEPTYVTHAGDGSGRLFVVERRGKIKVINDGLLQSEPFMDIEHLAGSEWPEQGLLSVAFHPDFADNRRLFVHYTNTEDDVVIAGYQTGPDSSRVDLTTAKLLLTIPQPFNNHNGGQLKFGPGDGYLYIGSGEGGLGKHPPSDSLLGKILRIDVDSDQPYSVPGDNPFINTPGFRPEIWATGLRNPWRFSFDRLTGDLYIGDVGENLYEEINVEPVGSPGGRNYGWNIMEGYHCYESETCDQAGLTLPTVEYERSQGCSVIGGYVYRGSQYPPFNGIYLYGDFCSGKIWGLPPGGSPVQLLDTILNISSFGEDEAGELYVVDLQGTIHRLIVPGTGPLAGWPGAWPLALEPEVILNANFEDDFRLIGYSTNRSLASPGGIVWLTLFWQGKTVPEADVFVQVRDENNETVAQADHPLYISGSTLIANDNILRDGATLALPPDMLPGPYRILVGFYHPQTLARLGVIGDQSGENAVILTEFVIE